MISCHRREIEQSKFSIDKFDSYLLEARGLNENTK
jgi:hypothetical protein